MYFPGKKLSYGLFSVALQSNKLIDIYTTIYAFTNNLNSHGQFVIYDTASLIIRTIKFLQVIVIRRVL